MVSIVAVENSKRPPPPNFGLPGNWLKIFLSKNVHPKVQNLVLKTHMGNTGGKILSTVSEFSGSIRQNLQYLLKHYKFLLTTMHFPTTPCMMWQRLDSPKFFYTLLQVRWLNLHISFQLRSRLPIVFLMVDLRL